MTTSERHFEQIMHLSVRWKAMAVSYASSGVGSFFIFVFHRRTDRDCPK